MAKQQHWLMLKGWVSASSQPSPNLLSLTRFHYCSFDTNYWTADLCRPSPTTAMVKCVLLGIMCHPYSKVRLGQVRVYYFKKEFQWVWHASSGIQETFVIVEIKFLPGGVNTLNLSVTSLIQERPLKRIWTLVALERAWRCAREANAKCIGDFIRHTLAIYFWSRRTQKFRESAIGPPACYWSYFLSRKCQ